MEFVLPALTCAHDTVADLGTTQAPSHGQTLLCSALCLFSPSSGLFKSSPIKTIRTKGPVCLVLWYILALQASSSIQCFSCNQSKITQNANLVFIPAGLYSFSLVCTGCLLTWRTFSPLAPASSAFPLLTECPAGAFLQCLKTWLQSLELPPQNSLLSPFSPGTTYCNPGVACPVIRVGLAPVSPTHGADTVTDTNMKSSYFWGVTL